MKVRQKWDLFVIDNTSYRNCPNLRNSTDHKSEKSY